MEITNEIEKLSLKVTDYGYNDEYGYYTDWLDGVRPIIEKGVSEIISKIEKEINEALSKIKSDIFI